MILSSSCFVQPRVDCSGATAARSAPACTSGRQHQLSKVPSKAKLAAGHLFNDSHGSHSSPAALRVLKDEAEQPLIGFGEVVEVADLKGVRVLVKKGQPEVQYLVAWKVQVKISSSMSCLLASFPIYSDHSSTA